MATVSQNQRNYDLTNSIDPKGGPKGIPLLFDFSTASSFTLDMQQYISLHKMESVQGIFVDNSLNSAPFVIVVNSFGQTIEVPATAQAYLPLLVPANNANLTFSSAGAVVVKIALLNVPIPALVWYPLSATSSSTVIPGGSNGTDQSANKPALAANLLKNIAVNTARRGYVIQNQSADQIQVVFDDGTGVGQTILLLRSGGANAAGDSVDMTGLPHWGRILIYGPSALDQVGAREW